MAEYYYNNKLYNERELKAEFPNVAINFTSLPDGIVPVLETPKPTPTTNLKRVIRNGVAIDGLGNTIQAWVEVDMFTSDLLDVDGVTVLKTIAEQETEYLAEIEAEALSKIVKETETRVQNHINETVKARGYDDENSIAKYLIVGNPYYDECKAISLWIGAVWKVAEDYQNGVRLFVSIEAVIEDLPALII